MATFLAAQMFNTAHTSLGCSAPMRSWMMVSAYWFTKSSHSCRTDFGIMLQTSSTIFLISSYVKHSITSRKTNLKIGQFRQGLCVKNATYVTFLVVELIFNFFHDKLTKDTFWFVGFFSFSSGHHRRHNISIVSVVGNFICF